MRPCLPACLHGRVRAQALDGWLALAVCGVGAGAGEGSTYALQLADTVVVGADGAELCTGQCPKTWDKVSYEMQVRRACMHAVMAKGCVEGCAVLWGARARARACCGHAVGGQLVRMNE